MAVITKYFIVRDGVELDKVFEDKKEALAYDKMLDAAEKLAAFIKQGQLDIELDDKTVDEVAVYLAKNAPEVNKILKGVNNLKSKAPAAGKTPKSSDTQSPEGKKTAGKKSGAARKEK